MIPSTRLLAIGTFTALALAWMPREPLAPLSPRATIAHYNGSTGINTPLWNLANGDVPAAVVAAACPLPVAFGPLVGNADNAKAVAGQSWGPILNIGTCASGSGNAVIRLRTACVNGPSVTLPGGCLSKVLIAGTLLGSLVVPHNGVTCNVPNQLIPTSAVGSAWAAQATVNGGSATGVVASELSSVIYGVVDVCF